MLLVGYVGFAYLGQANKLIDKKKSLASTSLILPETSVPRT